MSQLFVRIHAQLSTKARFAAFRPQWNRRKSKRQSLDYLIDCHVKYPNVWLNTEDNGVPRATFRYWFPTVANGPAPTTLRNLQ